jgi:hypothetical protein
MTDANLGRNTMSMAMQMRSTLLRTVSVCSPLAPAG